jgi:hypothetical protein
MRQVKSRVPSAVLPGWVREPVTRWNWSRCPVPSRARQLVGGVVAERVRKTMSDRRHLSTLST